MNPMGAGAAVSGVGVGRLLGRTAMVLAGTLAIYVVVDLIADLIIGPLHRAIPDFAAIPGSLGQQKGAPAVIPAALLGVIPPADIADTRLSNAPTHPIAAC